MQKEALLYKTFDDGHVHCGLCAHRCRIALDQFGICGVRQNIGGTLYTYAYGRTIAAHVDPIEKKPLYHVYPGTQAFSVATIGCNFQCGFCQNWQISQLNVRDGGVNLPGEDLLPADIVAQAQRRGCRSIAYTYTEPTIFFEYAYETARLAREQGIANVFVSNGYMTPEAGEMIVPFLNAANIDLKSFRDEYYRKHCKAGLEPVLDTIRLLKSRGVWVEVTTLIIPGENDSEEELRDIAGFIADTGLETPWHISRFHPDYEFMDHEPTAPEVLKRAGEIGREAGLRYIYLGNLAGVQNTSCPQCGNVLIGRSYYQADHVAVRDGHCASCGTPADGLFA